MNIYVTAHATHMYMDIICSDTAHAFLNHECKPLCVNGNVFMKYSFLKNLIVYILQQQYMPLQYIYHTDACRD